MESTDEALPIADMQGSIQILEGWMLVINHELQFHLQLGHIAIVRGALDNLDITEVPVMHEYINKWDNTYWIVYIYINEIKFTLVDVYVNLNDYFLK